MVGTFLAAGLFQAATKDFGLVLRGADEGEELESVLGVWTVETQAWSGFRNRSFRIRNNS